MESRLQRDIGLRIRALRRQKAMTQEELGERAGKTAESISNIERGVTMPPLDTLESLVGILEIPLADLFAIAGGDGQNHDRVQLEARLHGLARSLSDRGLEIAVRQIEALTEI